MWHASAPHRPRIGHRTGYSLHAKISLHTAQACDCVSRFRGVFAHSYKRCRPRLFLRALMDPAHARGPPTPAESTSRSFGAARPANARGEPIRSRTVRSWRRRIRLCGRFPYRPTIGGACGMYRPSIGHLTGYSLHAKISLHTAQACDCVSRFRGVFAHSYKRCRPRLFLRALMDPAHARGPPEEVGVVRSCRENVECFEGRFETQGLSYLSIDL